ncbi:AAA domain-containing protein [Pseudomonas peradeniyensis]|uniref:AAA domain-containing protein n=1 Tax=Pseudomonas TaxID=286 RepID=UPI0006832E87|nr:MULTISPECIES: AAA domain-containing protein [Pseudomonas]MCU7281717.1 AAA domain-containing protein [Pseudomonas peradeniyensis]
METIIWDGGLKAQEVDAINKMSQRFSPAVKSKKNSNREKSLQDQMKGIKDNDIFPWKGYAGFRFVNAKGKEGEFDLIIVTNCNVLIVELKDWHGGSITCAGDIWFKGGQNMGRSPVSVTREKKFTLENKLKRLAKKFTNKGYVPVVDFFIVMTGTSDFSKLPEDQLLHTITLEDFLKLSEREVFLKRFRPHPNAQTLNQDFKLFDDLLVGNQTKPKPFNFSGYEAKEKIFEHPKKAYVEYLAASEISKSSEALMRVWQFNKIAGEKAFTAEGRAEIVSREREVLASIHNYNRDLYNHCLRSLTSFQKSEVTAEYCEVYELPPGHVRFNQFIGKYGVSFDWRDRFTVVKLLVAKFSDLHQLKIAHRDIAEHSLWISPSKQVALSSFISAYHSPIGTVGDYRERLSVGAAQLPDMKVDSSLTVFQQDVHALGIIVWHIISGQRMSPNSLDGLFGKLSSSEDWLSPIIKKAISGGFEDASEFFDEIKCAEPLSEAIPTFDDSELDGYRRPINHSRQFREDDVGFIVENSEKEVYLSNGLIVKAWLNVGSPSSGLKEKFETLSFLKKIDKLVSLKPIYLPVIREYGLASKSNSLYLVSDKVEGVLWSQVVVGEESKIPLIVKLVDAVEHLHGLGVSHGDLHPENVMIDLQDELYLIDLPDFSFSDTEQKNHRYSPENIDGCTAFERDTFAVMKMSCELLGVAWGEASEKYQEITLSIKEELEDRQFGFKDLGRFRKGLNRIALGKEAQVIEIEVNDNFNDFSIYPDNGSLYVKVEESSKSPLEVKVTFTGLGGMLVAIYNKSKRSFEYCLKPRERSFLNKRDVDESSLEVDVTIKVVSARWNEHSKLSELLNANESFLRAVALIEESGCPDDEADVPTEIQEAFGEIEGESESSLRATSLEIPTRKLWQAILETEAESYPYIEVNGPVLPVPEHNSELIITYASEVDPLETFRRDDEVEALIVDAEGVERFIGEVSLKQSALKEVWLTRARPGAYNLKEGDNIFFRTKQDRASYRKRKAALGKLLDRGGVLPELVDLFDPLCEVKAVDYRVDVKDEHFSRYDREDEQGNTISLNLQQREAFVKLVNQGPLCLLQGPPGTGKTEFIAAFVHYLIEKLDVKRILLVSQSHEAVNTAAGRIRKHCKRLGTDLEVVRFSNREGAVSDALKDVYSHAITTEKRGLFEAEYKYRVEAMSEALGLDAGFLSSVTDAEFNLFRQIDNLQSLLASSHGDVAQDDLVDFKKISLELHDVIRQKLERDYDIEFSTHTKLSDLKQKVIAKLCRAYGVQPDEIRRGRALAKISREMLDAWSGERVNCDEFYARSRQLVAGTCVGMGQGHIGLHNNVYDWVIIDEAARSIASELAIAMQCAKRVLLVGDHLQLPPLYSDAHKKALARRLGITGAKEEIDEILQSDFARAFNSNYGAQVSSALLTQYRMSPEIGDLVSETFYGGKLKNGNRPIPDFYKNAPDFLVSPVTWLDTAAHGKKADHSEDRGVSIYNRCEADLVIDLLKKISKNHDFIRSLSALIKDDDAAVGVICMYSEQKKLIRQKFNQEQWSDEFKRLVKIDTVDSYQGKENRVIIVSLTRSDRPRSPGFLKAPNRINVAMSRAMDRLVIIGNTDMWVGRNQSMPLGKVIAYMSEFKDAGYKILKASLGGR